MHAENADENTHPQGLCHGKLTVKERDLPQRTQRGIIFYVKNTHHQILNPISYILTPELDTDLHGYQLININ